MKILQDQCLTNKQRCMLPPITTIFVSTSDFLAFFLLHLNRVTLIHYINTDTVLHKISLPSIKSVVLKYTLKISIIEH
jgi:hypothetical protein